MTWPCRLGLTVLGLTFVLAPAPLVYAGVALGTHAQTTNGWLWWPLWILLICAVGVYWQVAAFVVPHLKPGHS